MFQSRRPTASAVKAGIEGSPVPHRGTASGVGGAPMKLLRNGPSDA